MLFYCLPIRLIYLDLDQWQMGFLGFPFTGFWCPTMVIEGVMWRTGTSFPWILTLFSSNWGILFVQERKYHIFSWTWNWDKGDQRWVFWVLYSGFVDLEWVFQWGLWSGITSSFISNLLMSRSVLFMPLDIYLESKVCCIFRSSYVVPLVLIG